MNKSTSFQPGCKICRTLNDGICSNFCLMDKHQQQQYIKANAHLFREAKKTK